MNFVLCNLPFSYLLPEGIKSIYKPFIVYGALLSSVRTVKLLLVPLPCTGILTIGADEPPKTVNPKTASAKIAGGLTVPKEKLLVG
jgi:hypothetical protein